MHCVLLSVSILNNNSWPAAKLITDLLSPELDAVYKKKELLLHLSSSFIVSHQDTGQKKCFYLVL